MSGIEAIRNGVLFCFAPLFAWARVWSGRQAPDPSASFYADLPQWMEAPLLTTSTTEAVIRMECRRCRCQWLGPTDPTLRAEVAEAVRAHGLLRAMAALKWAGFAFRDAKPTLLHIPHLLGICRRCGRSIDGADVVTCRCGSLTLNW